MEGNSNTDNRSTRQLHLTRKAMWDASMSNHARYIDSATGLFDKKFLEDRSCPACESDNKRDLFKKSGGTYVMCHDCKMVFISPVFKNEFLEEYYRSNHELQGQVVSSDVEFYRNLYTKGLKAISAHTSNLQNILDVGCSTGTFLDLAKNAGWSSFGLELNSKEAQIARTRGHVVQESALNNATLETKFDAITLWDVFEHIKDGFEFLTEAKKILNKNGVVFIQSPSRDALAARIAQENCNMFDGLEHVNLYGYQSLNFLCERAGFKISHFETVISEIGVMNNYLDYQDPYLGDTDNKISLLNLIDEQLIHKNKLGYKFQACLTQK